MEGGLSLCAESVWNRRAATMLSDLLGVEVTARRERYLTTGTRLAYLPFRHTLEEFDFSFQPSIDERHSLSL